MISAVNNTAAFSVFTSYSTNMDKLSNSMTRLSTGVKTVADDGAGVAISERMRSQARSTAMARNNADNAVSMMQTADGWLQKVNDMLGRMHELAIEAQDATKGTEDVTNIKTEFQALQAEIARITDGTNGAAKFNGKALFDTTFESGDSTQIGADTGQTISLTLDNLQASSSDTVGNSVEWGSVIDSTDVSVSGTNTIRDIANAVDHVSKLRASVGAQLSRLDNTRGGLLTYEDNIRAAESRIRDVDMARESAEMTKYQILSQVGNAMLAQANMQGAGVLQLL